MHDENKAPERTFEQVQNEYGQLCSKLGHLEYSKYTIENDIAMIKATLKDLNLEAAAIKAKEQAAPAPDAPKENS